ncbi:VanZ family protein [Spirochaeta isovalerica]|uniref:VanZ-like domain-containing protein n=1 Tax=Spirochaeta isovalerica TaxID=150 RepID=A0A841R6J0_9SPIO|nr:VanZ family protein [Spirochaeta isovalerica]MBB6478388.1 hypothetical protein [Spirochaeta isovalerica]
MVLFGFYPAARSATNQAKIIPGKGLVFTGNSMVFSNDIFRSIHREEDNFSLFLRMTPVYPERLRFGIILQIYNRETNEGITIGQWGTSLMVLSDQDYSNRNRTPKIYGDLGKEEDLKQIGIHSDNKGTSLVVNSSQIAAHRELRLSLPLPAEKNTIILGNGMNGTTPWSGELSSLAIYSGNNETADFDFATIDSAGFQVFSVPGQIKDLDPEVLGFPSFSTLGSAVMSLDVFMNFFGFIPLGILLSLNLYRNGWLSRRKALFISGILTLFFSLSIEISQVWIPGRDSSLLDLILNSAGGFLGAALYYTFSGKKSQ